MQAAILDDRTGRNTSFLTSLAVHLLAGAALVFVPLTRQRFTEPEEPIPVAIIVPAPPRVAPEPTQPVSRPQPRDDAAPGDADRASVQPAVPASLPPPGVEADNGLIRPRTMLSAGALANPRSRKARQQLRTLSADEHTVQLCNIEAMEQIHAMNAGYSPEAISPYAMQELKLRGGSVVADGAAFYSGRQWYRLRFACDVVADKVVSFAFRPGQPIPRARWDEANLGEPSDDSE